jgi:hypothetical protein
MDETMKIESILRRPGGTKVTLDETEYHFKPGPDGREIAEVADEAHIKLFLAVPEGYRVVDPAPRGRRAKAAGPEITPAPDADAASDPDASTEDAGENPADVTDGGLSEIETA